MYIFKTKKFDHYRLSIGSFFMNTTMSTYIFTPTHHARHPSSEPIPLGEYREIPSTGIMYLVLIENRSTKIHSCNKR